MKSLFLLSAVVFGLAGCVNLHVHFPQAPAEHPPGADAGVPRDKPNGEAQ